MKIKSILWKVLNSTGYFIQYGCLAHCTFTYLAEFVMCSGPSMEPTIHPDDILFTEHVSPLVHKIDRGDIVIAKCPSNPQQQICKRVVALGGDKVRTGFVTVEVVPVGHVWLEGDNAENSSDSRSYGPVPLGLIRSRAVCKVWPLSDISLLTS